MSTQSHMVHTEIAYRKPMQENDVLNYNAVLRTKGNKYVSWTVFKQNL